MVNDLHRYEQLFLSAWCQVWNSLIAATEMKVLKNPDIKPKIIMQRLSKKVVT